MNLPLLHPPVVHFPIALLLVGSTAALIYLFGRRRLEYLVLAWWSLRLGWIGAALAVLTGLVDQSGLPPKASYSGVLNWHIGLGMATVVVYAFLLYRQWLWSARRRRHADRAAADLLDSPEARTWVALLLILGMTLVVVGGSLGGSLVYTWGVNILS